MTKLSRQDKIDIYNSWKHYGKSSKQLAKEYGVCSGNLRYMLSLIERHGLKILDKGHITYSVEFKEAAIKRVLFDHETSYRVSLELGLPNQGTISNWIRNYIKDGYNVINYKKDRPTHERQRQANPGASKANQRPRTRELEAYCSDRIHKKLDALVSQRTKNPKPKK